MLSTMPWQATALDSAAAVASYSDFKMRCTVLLDSDTRKQWCSQSSLKDVMIMIKTACSQSLSRSGNDDTPVSSITAQDVMIIMWRCHDNALWNTMEHLLWQAAFPNGYPQRRCCSQNNKLLKMFYGAPALRDGYVCIYIYIHVYIYMYMSIYI